MYLAYYIYTISGKIRAILPTTTSKRSRRVQVWPKSQNEGLDCKYRLEDFLKFPELEITVWNCQVLQSAGHRRKRHVAMQYTATKIASVVSQLFAPHGCWPARLLLSWDFPRQDYWSGMPMLFSQGSSGIKLLPLCLCIA